MGEPEPKSEIPDKTEIDVHKAERYPCRMTIRRATLFAGATLIAGVVFLTVASQVRPLRVLFGKSTLVRYVHFKLKGFVLPIITRSVIDDYLESHDTRKLQIGAGGALLEGWLNTDIAVADGVAYIDATEPFPLEDGSFQYVYSEHVIEHLPYEGGLAMLRESHRILATGGKIRIATPDLSKFASLFQAEKTPEMERFLDQKIKWFGWPTHLSRECFVTNYEMRSFGHAFLYDLVTLATAMEAAGFHAVQRMETGQSDDPQLRGIESRTREIDRFETMILEAVKR